LPSSAFDRVISVFRAASAAVLGGMMLLTCADVVGRFLGRPILGAVELGVLMSALVLAFSMPYTQREKGHVGVELLSMRLGTRGKALLDLCTAVAGSALFAVIAWQCWVYASQMKASGEVSMTLQLPAYYVIYLMAASFGGLAAVQFTEVIAALRQAVGR